MAKQAIFLITAALCAGWFFVTDDPKQMFTAFAVGVVSAFIYVRLKTQTI